MSTTSIFFNQSFDKKRLKTFISWVFKTFGEKEALSIVEQLKSMGFQNATKAGLSIGLHDLKTPFKKRLLISRAQRTIHKADQEFRGAEVTATERSQRIVDTWHRTSEDLRQQVVDYFSTYDQFNSVYMMALSGARGNFSQVRQLIGMRGLMADPQGQIISFPILSNLREGLTLTEYFISCSGARKGLVDTALRTADTGYLTRRLVDISHHIVVKRVTCYTSRGIALKTLRTPQKILLPLRDRLIGRVLAENVSSNNQVEFGEEQNSSQKENPILSQPLLPSTGLSPNKVLQSTETQRNQRDKDKKKVIALKNQEISPELALKISLFLQNNVSRTEASVLLENSAKANPKTIADLGHPRLSEQVLVRSPLTCTYTHEVCQLCYGWSMAQGSLVSLGEAVGVIAGQSIGEPGTQLTMRTFHTGGVFSGDLLQEIRAPHSGKILFPKALQGLLIRTSQGKIAFLIKVSGELLVEKTNLKDLAKDSFAPLTKKTTRVPLAPSTILFVRQGEKVKSHQILAELAITTEEGNQPIKSRQTLFSEMRGRIVQWRSMVSRVHRAKGMPNKALQARTKQSLVTLNLNNNVRSSNFVVDLAIVRSKPGIQAYLGEPSKALLTELTRNSSYSVLEKTSSNKPSIRKLTKEKLEDSFVMLTEQSAQHYEETWSRLNNITLKKIALDKRYGLGSIEPPQALQLGLLSVIATRVGSSERTGTKFIASNHTTTLLSNKAKSCNTSKKGKPCCANKTETFNAQPLVVQAKSKLLQNKHASKYVNESLATFRERTSKRFFDSDRQMTCLQHLNTIAKEGDLVDENYTIM